MITIGFLRIFSASIWVMGLLVLAFWLLSGCATVPAGKTAADLTATLWADMGYPGQNPPEVHAIQPAEMAALRNNAVVATYICRGRAMYIRDDHVTDPDWLAGVLIHELTHHKQCIEGRLSGIRDTCMIEVEAYRAQIAWFRKLADARGFFEGTNARNMAEHVQRHMDKNFSQCL